MPTKPGMDEIRGFFHEWLFLLDCGSLLFPLLAC